MARGSGATINKEGLLTELPGLAASEVYFIFISPKNLLMETLLIIACILLIILIILVIVFRPKSVTDSIQSDALKNQLNQIQSSFKEDFKLNREEIGNIAKENRSELNESLKQFREETATRLQSIADQNQKALEAINKTLEEKLTGLTKKIDENHTANKEKLSADLKDFTLEQRDKFDELRKEQKELTTKTVEQLEKVTEKVEQKLAALNEQAQKDNNLMRESLVNAFKGFQETFDKNVKSFNDLQKEKFNQLEQKQKELVENTEKKLEEVRKTVDEKLQKTLSERLGQSFEIVGKQLESVQKGLGEMQTLAQDVGGLKRVLSNVKMRGGFGEVQLSLLLENILAPDQYETNVPTKLRSNERVEFAVKMPNKEGERNYVWLPIDAKFPKEAYEQLQNAYDAAEPAQIEAAQKNLESVIKKMAKDICDKYLDPPNSTDFGIMFLPFEGIYAEVVRKAGLLEEIQRSCKVVVTGPTTLAAILNSLQMGFRTLAIQKRSSEVWDVLSSVKKEFNTFGGLLEKAQNNIQTGLNQLEDVVGTRTRAIQRKLRSVEVADDTKVLLDETGAEMIKED